MRSSGLTAHNLAGPIFAGMNDLLDALYALRPLWLPSLVLSLPACAVLALLAYSGIGCCTPDC